MERLLDQGRQMDWDDIVAEVLTEPGAEQPLLAPREHEVAGLVAEGLTNAAIAGNLVIAPRTVESHIDHIKQKLGLGSRSEIIVWVLRGSERGAWEGER